MLKRIIKRSGVVEDFDAKKINKWVIWAAGDLINSGRVDVSSVIMEVVAVSPEEMTSQDLQLALAKKCVSRHSWPYSLMGGALYAVWCWKEFYGDCIPTVKEIDQQLLECGIMKKMNYSDAEYELIEKMIDHTRDIKLAEFQIKQDINKYSLQNKITKQKFETPQFIFMRMAMALAEKDETDQRMIDVSKWYIHFSAGLINPPTPNFNNLGTPHNGYASCCLYKSGDEKRSLGVGKHIAYTMTYMSAGIGGYIESRSLGEGVAGNTIVHQGKLPFYAGNGKDVKEMTKGGRGGAATQYITCFDPEIETVIMLQNPRTSTEIRNRDIHFSVMINSLFARKAGKKEKIFTFNVKSAPDLHRALFSGDKELFAHLYDKYEKDPTFEKNYIDAYKLAAEIENQGHEVSTLYSLDIEEVNRHTPFLDPIHSSNLCVAPETLILTDRGYYPIAHLENMMVNVWNGEEFSQTQVLKTGVNQKLLKVMTDSGPELDCTEYHKFYIFDGYGKPYKEVRAAELRPGDKLCKFELPVIEGFNTFADPYINGFYTGDGSLTEQGQRVYLYGEKLALAENFPGGGPWYGGEHDSRAYKHYDHLQPKYFVPDANYTIHHRLEWLAGLADSDGCIYRNGDNQQLVIDSVELNFLKSVQLMLQTLGVSAKVRVSHNEGSRQLPANDGSGELKDFWCKTNYRLIVTSNDLQQLLSLGIVFRRLQVVKHQPQRDAKQFVAITNVYDVGRFDDTYCFTEPKRHLGMFNGILTGQCGEITQPTSEYEHITDLYKTDHERGEISLCNLGGIVVSKIPFTKAGDALYEEVAYYTLKMADTTIDMADYEIPHLGYTAAKRRNAAIGMLGVAEVFARMGINFDTQQGLDLAHRIAERHAYFVIKASLRLGQEKGNAPWMHKTKWPKGWLPIDTYKKSVDTLTQQALRYDWEELRAAIIANGGIRNSSLIAHMPTESSSKASGVPNGIYPIRDFYLKKTDQNNTIDWLAPDDDLYGDQYQNAYEIKTLDLIKYYAVIQKFTDQAISADFYENRVKNPILNRDELVSNLINRVRYGVKSKYYQNSLTPAAGNMDDNASTAATSVIIPMTEIIGAGQRADCSSGACTL